MGRYPTRNWKSLARSDAQIDQAPRHLCLCGGGSLQGDRTKQRIKYLAQKTFNKQVLGDIGGFGGLFRLDTAKYADPVLVSSADGVGTKLKVAFALGMHHTVGADLVNHCVNDIAVQGATPLFFLDYLAIGQLGRRGRAKRGERRGRSLPRQRLRPYRRGDGADARLLLRWRI